MSVSRETTLMFDRYENLIKQWNRRINLVSPGTLPDIRGRHFEDCLQILEIMNDPQGAWLDLGSGGGLPGLVLAIATNNGGISFTLVESDQRKSAFLGVVKRELQLTNATILSKRIETLAPQNADFISARALAPLPQLMAYIHRHLSATGTAFAMKGRQWRAEVEEARKSWCFDYTAHPSRTEPGAAILEIKGVAYGRS